MKFKAEQIPTWAFFIVSFGFSQMAIWNVPYFELWQRYAATGTAFAIMGSMKFLKENG